MRQRRIAGFMLLTWVFWAGLYGFDHQLTYVLWRVDLQGLWVLILVVLFCTSRLQRHPREVGFVLVGLGTALVVIMPRESWLYQNPLKTLALGGFPPLAIGLIQRPWEAGGRISHWLLAVLLVLFMVRTTLILA